MLCQLIVSPPNTIYEDSFILHSLNNTANYSSCKNYFYFLVYRQCHIFFLAAGTVLLFYSTDCNGATQFP